MKKSQYQTIDRRPDYIKKILFKLFELNKTQVWLAKQIEIYPQNLSGMMTGRRDFSLPVAYRIALTLGFDPEEYIKEIKEAS